MLISIIIAGDGTPYIYKVLPKRERQRGTDRERERERERGST